MDQRKAKIQLRNEMSSMRLNLSKLAVGEKSKQVISRLRELEPFRRAQAVMFYSSIRNEVDLSPLFEELRSQGKTVLLPRVRGNMLEAVIFEGWESCGSGSFGILEPVGPAFPAEDIEAVFTPGLAFDAKGFRLGYGKGYYDRFLPYCSREAFLCGVAYEFQVVDTIFPGENDIPLHWIVTDCSEVAVDMKFF